MLNFWCSIAAPAPIKKGFSDHSPSSTPSTHKYKKISNLHDLNGRLRRRMTVLSRDPKLNDKLLRKRALERQIKVGRNDEHNKT